MSAYPSHRRTGSNNSALPNYTNTSSSGQPDSPNQTTLARSPTHPDGAMSLAKKGDAAHHGGAQSSVSTSASSPLPQPQPIPLWQMAALAAIYMLGSIALFLLIRFSKQGKSASYDNAAAVFFTELLKWAFSVGMMYYRTGKFLPTSVFREQSYRVGIYYAVPSLIYAVYNNLTYVNLTYFDPGTYQVFMQTRVMFTGLLYVQILRRPLTNRKWAALALLTLGVISKYWTWNLQIDYRVSFMLFQASLSAFAGVYNEFLLKRDIQMDVNEQNFFMYSFALFFNLSIGLYSNPTYYVSGQVFASLSGILALIVIVSATVGIVTSLILKFINVIVKAFASACEVLLTAVFAWWLLNESLTSKDFVASAMVMVAIYVYYTAPAAPTPPVISSSQSAADKV